MLRPLRLAAVAGLLCASCASPKLLLEQHAGDLHRARTVVTAFYHDFGAEARLRDIPFVTVGTDGGPGYRYDVAHNVLFVTPHEHADFDTQRFFNRAAPDAGAATYDGLLFEFYTAHQMMHLLYDRLPLAPVSQYEEELRINVLTWLFLRKHGFARERSAGWLAALESIENHLIGRLDDGRRTDHFARALEVDDNASYWYVSAVSLRESHALAARYRHERDYVETLHLSDSPATARR